MALDQQAPRRRKRDLVYRPLFKLGQVVNSIVPLQDSEELTESLIRHQLNEGEGSSFTAANKVAVFLGRGLVCNKYTIKGYTILVKSILHERITYVTLLS